MKESNGLAGLPPKVFRIVIDMLDMVKHGHIFDREEEFLHIENRRQRKQTLKNLAVVSEGIRRLAQPLLFYEVRLALYTAAMRARAANMIQVIEARPESTTWLETLHVQLDTFPPPDATLLATISTLLGYLDGLRCLKVTTLHSTVVNAPPQLFASVTELQIVSIQTSADFDNFLSVLTRCPNLTSLACGIHTDIEGIEILPTTIPHLSQLKAPMELVRPLVVGRPVEFVTVVALVGLGQSESSVCTPDDLVCIARSSKPLRHLTVPSMDLDEDWIAFIVGLFPSLERLSFHVARTQQVGISTPLRRDIIYSASFISLGLAPCPPLCSPVKSAPPRNLKNNGATRCWPSDGRSVGGTAPASQGGS